jgi:peptidoglycan/xylan/chitin deacetylase (PgdA/CDA1 family)
MKKIFISIDDGHPNDLEIAEIFLKYNIKAIFYIPIKNIEGKQVLSEKDMKSLSENFEIGAHTCNHKDLTKLSRKEWETEIIEGKKTLENIIGREVTSFAPPRGKYNTAIVDFCYNKAGFKSFRSARLFNAAPSNRNNRVWHPNLHIYPHSKLVSILHCIKTGDKTSLQKRIALLRYSHLEIAPPLSEKLNEIHLWGHGWELRDENIDLEKIIKTILQT